MRQVRFREGSQGPHVDIWLWTIEVAVRDLLACHLDSWDSFLACTYIPASSCVQDDGSRMLRTADDTVTYNLRRESDVFPLKTGAWLGIHATIPNERFV